MYERYMDRVRLLLHVLPDVAREEVFALKGGTAINLFYRDMPRLSVDIDLTYLPLDEYEKSNANIEKALASIAATIDRNPSIRAKHGFGGGGGRYKTRIVVRDSQRMQIKIEASPVLHGSVYPPSVKTVTNVVMKQFGPVEMNVLGFGDVYGGKIHAALDRQHPRDFFDMKILYENEGFSDELLRVFMVYVASSNRPISDLLVPKDDFDETRYDNEFIGMTREAVTKEEILLVRGKLFADIRERLTGNIAEFLLSLHDGEPNFDLIGLPEAGNLPAVLWKVKNLEKLKRENPRKHRGLREELEGLFR